MSYLSDLIHYSSGNECPQSFVQWSALSLLGHVAGRKLWTMHGDYFQVFPNIYACMVGTAGSGKSTAKNIAKSIVTKEFPDFMVSASIQSREDIADQMASDACSKIWRDNGGKYLLKIPRKNYEYRPFYIISNELNSLLSVDKNNMVGFLVDIYDENGFSTGFKGQRRDNPERKQFFDNPYVSMLACATPKWFMGNLKFDLFEGGLGRRLIIVYDEKTKLIEEPNVPPGGLEAFARAVQHLRNVSRFYGEVKKTPEAKAFWRHWYHDKKRVNREDPILMQFHETKPIQVLKVALLLVLCERPLTLKMGAEHLQMAVHLLDELEPKILQLTSGIGRNELAGVGAQMLEYLERMGGVVSEIMLKKFFRRYLNNPEFIDVIKHFEDTEQIVLTGMTENGLTRRFYFTAERYQRYLYDQKNSSTGATPPSLVV
jgi:hypothetical protein